MIRFLEETVFRIRVPCNAIFKKTFKQFNWVKLSAFFGCHVTVYLRNGFFLSFTGFYCVFFKEINRSVLGFTEFLFSFLLISLTRA